MIIHATVSASHCGSMTTIDPAMQGRAGSFGAHVEVWRKCPVADRGVRGVADSDNNSFTFSLLHSSPLPGRCANRDS